MRNTTRQVVAYEKVEVESILDGPHQKNLERLAQDMEDSLRIYGRRCLLAHARTHQTLHGVRDTMTGYVCGIGTDAFCGVVRCETCATGRCEMQTACVP
jgi:hypothetical protein